MVVIFPRLKFCLPRWSYPRFSRFLGTSPDLGQIYENFSPHEAELWACCRITAWVTLSGHVSPGEMIAEDVIAEVNRVITGGP